LISPVGIIPDDRYNFAAQRSNSSTIHNHQNIQATGHPTAAVRGE
jgi:hypothetical protein